MTYTEQVDSAITLLTCCRDVFSSNLGSYTDYLIEDFSGLPQTLQVNGRLLHWNNTRPLPVEYFRFTIYHHLILSLDVK